MCGRFIQQRPTAEVAEAFAATALVDDPGPHFNLAPTQDALVIVEHEGERRIVAYRWGLVPHWEAAPSGRAQLFNARAETVATSPVFREAFRRRRCLVPVDGFYEWRREGRVRRPFLVRRRDGGAFALAGLWAGRRDPATGLVARSFTIVTARPNSVVAPLHDRMPVILAPEAWPTWLDPARPETGRLEALFEASAANDADLELVPVSRLVNDVNNEGPELIRPVEPTSEPAEELSLGLL